MAHETVTAHAGYRLAIWWEDYTSDHPVCCGELRSPHELDTIAEATVRERLQDVAERLSRRREW